MSGPLSMTAESPSPEARAINIAARLVPNATCLVRAMAAQRLLAYYGQASSLHIGVATPAGKDGWSPPARTQFDCLHAGYLPAFHRKSQQGSDEVPSIVAAGAGIHVNEAERLVAHDFQDVGVPA